MSFKKVALVCIIIAVFGIVIFLIYSWGNKETAYPQGIISWKGYYKDGFETQLFRPCGGNEWWWAEGNLGKIYAVIAPDGVLPDTFTTVYVELTGEVSPEGHYGHLEALKRQIEVNDVMRVEWEIPKECP